MKRDDEWGTMIDEATRRELWSALRQTIGENQADTLMTMLPTQPMPELATRQDVAAVTATLRAEIRASGDGIRAEMRKEFSEVRETQGAMQGEIGELRGEMRKEFSEVRETQGAMQGEIGELRGEMRAEIGKLRGDFDGLRGEFAELRGEFAEVRGEITGMRGDLRAEFSKQIIRLGLGLATVMVAMMSVILLLGFNGAFAPTAADGGAASSGVISAD